MEGSWTELDGGGGYSGPRLAGVWLRDSECEWYQTREKASPNLVLTKLAAEWDVVAGGEEISGGGDRAVVATAFGRRLGEAEVSTGCAGSRRSRWCRR